MAIIEKTSVSLRIFGDDLSPDSITDQLGHPPTYSEAKGEEIVGKKTGRVRVAKTGCWRLHAKEAVPGNLDAQITELLEKLTKEEKIWNKIASKYKIELFCGLFMGGEMEGEGISAENLLALGQRQIELSLGIYGPSED